jgi:hypothetical protein
VLKEWTKLFYFVAKTNSCPVKFSPNCVKSTLFRRDAPEGGLRNRASKLGENIWDFESTSEHFPAR